MNKKAELPVPEKYPGQFRCLKCGFKDKVKDLTFDEAIDLRVTKPDIGQDICPNCEKASFWLFMDYPTEITNRGWGRCDAIKS